MSPQATVQLLFVALAIVMFGLGLSLEVSDFRRLYSEKRAVLVALALQMIVLPLCALAITRAMSLQPPYAIGLMLLAAAPGSVSSNLYSHVFGGNVALNVSLTGVNTALSLLTLPLTCAWALDHFGAPNASLPSITGKLLETMGTLLLPVVAGMLVRAKAPAFAAKADKPMRIVSVIVLVLFSAAAIIKEWHSLVAGFAAVGGSVVLFNLLSLGLGYWSAPLLGIGRRSSLAITFQLGIRSAVLSIYIAMTTLNDTQFALPAAVYSITMVIFGLSLGMLVRNRVTPSPVTSANLAT